jgi:hypothetical protein
MSRAFKKRMPGAIYDKRAEEHWTELNAEERERALGYYTGATAAPEVTKKQRHTIMGNSMNQVALAGLIRCSLWASVPLHILHTLQYKLVHGSQLLLPTLLTPLPSEEPPNWDTHLASAMLDYLFAVQVLYTLHQTLRAKGPYTLILGLTRITCTLLYGMITYEFVRPLKGDLVFGRGTLNFDPQP